MRACLDSHAGVRLVSPARGLAADVPRRQQRTDGKAPSIHRPIRRLQVLVETGGACARVLPAAAALRDVVQACGIGLPGIKARSGTEVIPVVGEAADNRTWNRTVAIAERTAVRVAGALHLSLFARPQKPGDVTCNLHDMPQALPAGAGGLSP